MIRSARKVVFAGVAAASLSNIVTADSDEDYCKQCHDFLEEIKETYDCEQWTSICTAKSGATDEATKTAEQSVSFGGEQYRAAGCE